MVIIPFRMKNHHLDVGYATHPKGPPKVAGPPHHDACYKPYAIFDGTRWLLWYNGRHGSLEQIGVVMREGEDLGFD